MKFKVKTKILKEAIDIVNHATASISTSPVLESILIKANFKNAVFLSNNMEMAIEYIIDKDITISEEWAFCIPSKIFSSYVALITDEEIELELIKNNMIYLKTKSSDIKIKWFDAWEFPLIPNIKEEISFSINGRILKKSIEKTLFSTAEGNIRPMLAGIYMGVNWSEAVFASTDTFRLSEYKVSTKEKFEKEFSQIIPSKTAHELKMIVDEKSNIKVVSGENQVWFFFGNIKLYSRLLIGKFPDYQAFFPNSYITKIVVNRIDLMQALKKINLISKENNYSIKMSFSLDNEIIIETSETQIWEWKEKVVWSIEWEQNIIGINSIYLLEVLWVIETSHIEIDLESSLSPTIIRPVIDDDNISSKGFRHLLMPLKI